MSYQIIIKKPAKKFMDRLPAGERKRLVAAIERLPGLGDIKRLQGQADVFRLRVEDYRVLFTVDHGALIVCVIAVGNRGEIYKHE